MPKYFFSATQGAHSQITGLFDFVWATAAAMWNLRWQVNGYIQVVPEASVEQLRARFTEGADINGANFRRACVCKTWSQQKESFASILLVNSIAVFEGWIDEVLEALGKNIKTINTALQFPDSTAKDGKGVAWAIGEITNVECCELKAAFYQTLCKGRYYSRARLDAMLLCYRFFKELRNCSMHRSGIANQRLVESYQNFFAVATTVRLGVSEVPKHSVPVINTHTSLSLRGVVGFTGILLKIIATLDAELCRSKLSEASFVSKWRAANPNNQMLSSVQKKRARQVVKLTCNAGFPEPSDALKFGSWLNQVGLTQF
jgi:hypothetical protein